MSQPVFVSPDQVRRQFSAAMSQMYRQEVPAYGALLDLVDSINHECLAENPQLADQLAQVENLDALSEQRHGAIRIGKVEELAMMRRLFAVMGMFPVSYYDLSVAGVPVHSTAFRPIEAESIRNNPFRVFCSLLRVEMIEDPELRAEAEQVLASRDIFGDDVRHWVAVAEQQGGLDETQAQAFVAAILEVFRWHQQARVDSALYQKLLASHPLVADVVSFKGPHINHLTPRSLDIDRVQQQLHTTGAKPKAVVEGPPRRQCNILLRQTAFLAFEEAVQFVGQQPGEAGGHTARFGEVEQRGCALTAKGRELYDQLLGQVRQVARPLNDGSNNEAYHASLEQIFSALPDDYASLRSEGLAYFHYNLTDAGKAAEAQPGASLEQLIERGLVRFDPITYEDFLPVSAAGIFQSNLGEKGEQDFGQNPNQQAFEQALGASVYSEFELYQASETASIERCMTILGA